MAEEKEKGGSGSDGTFSLEDLDQILEAETPGFSESLEGIKADGVQDTSSIEAFSVDSKESAEDEALDGPEATDDGALTPLQKLKRKLLRPVYWVRDFFSDRWRVFRNRIVLWRARTSEFIRHTLPELLKFSRTLVKSYYQSGLGALKAFWARPGKERLAIAAIVFCLAGSIFIFAKAFQQDWIPGLDDKIVRGFDEVGENLGSYDQQDQYIGLFEAFPEIEFQVRLQKVVVNLRRDPQSGNLPMGLFEFYLGVDSRDTAVEIRDREKEIIDLVQRTLEGFTYTEVMSRQGKVRMKARLRDNLNGVLNQGRVMNVYLNRIVTNH